MKLAIATTLSLLSLLIVPSIGSFSLVSADPTCSGTLGIAVHGQHIVGDYVSGIGHGPLAWPPSGGVVGQATSGAGGAVVPGGPGPGFHFPNGFSPGASFCLTQSQAPGIHLGP
jgi:hypothetical protein